VSQEQVGHAAVSFRAVRLHWVASRSTHQSHIIPFPFRLPTKGAVVILVAAVASGQDVNVLLE
jgi:hypothetical protein